MPLVAIVDGIRIIAPFLTEEQWDAISPHGSKIVIPCCGTSGFKRVSRGGIRHFVHKTRPNDCNWRSETEEHLRLKELIAVSCLAAGWKTEVEYSHADWRADIWATSARARIAFEVQLSPTTLEDLLARQNKYARDNVRGCWFYGEKAISAKSPWEPVPIPARSDLPAFDIHNRNGMDEVRLGDCYYRLADAIRLLLQGRVQFCSRQQQEIRRCIDFLYLQCWRCKRETGIVKVSVLTSTCSGTYEETASDDGDGIDYVMKPFILKKAADFLSSKAGRGLEISAPERQYSPSSQRSYNSFRCCQCNALFGREFVLRVYEGEEQSLLVARHVISQRNVVERVPHWCISENRQFCC